MKDAPKADIVTFGVVGIDFGINHEGVDASELDRTIAGITTADGVSNIPPRVVFISRIVVAIFEADRIFSDGIRSMT